MNLAAISPFFLRELAILLPGRLTLAFALFALAAGAFPLLRGDDVTTAEAPLYLLQVSVYLFPLVGILLGTGSSQGESTESELLLAQPYPRFARLAGKSAALLLVSGGCLVLVFLPVFLRVPAGGRGAVAALFLSGFLVLAVFVEVGMAVGFCQRNGVKAHLVSLAVWAFLLFGTDLVALLLVQLGWVRDHPGIWVAWLMANPLDTFRIGTLFGIQAIPFQLDSVPWLARWWIGHTVLWLAVICGIWTAAALFAARIGSARFNP